MRDLTEEERGLLERRRAGLDTFIQESFPVLVDFMERLELPQPHMVLREAEKYLPPVDSWMRSQVVTPKDRIWILTRIGYFIGELLNQRLGGCWFLDEDPQSPYFSQYVVGQFTRVPNTYARISPFALAAHYVDQPPGRSLSDLMTRAEDELHQCTQERS